MASGVPASDKRGSSFFVLQSHGEGVSRDDGRRTARVARRRRRRRGIMLLTVAPGRARGARMRRSHCRRGCPPLRPAECRR